MGSDADGTGSDWTVEVRRGRQGAASYRKSRCREIERGLVGQASQYVVRNDWLRTGVGWPGCSGNGEAGRDWHGMSASGEFWRRQDASGLVRQARAHVFRLGG